MRKHKNSVGVARKEKELVDALVTGLQKSRKEGTRVVVSSELDCFQGIADVVAAVGNGYRLFPRGSTRSLRQLTFSSAKVLAALRGRRLARTRELARETGLSPGTVRKQLRILEGLGILRVRQRGKVYVRREVRIPYKDITAFEVKVKDWAGGIYQARNYRSFANRVCLAMPADRAKLLTRKARLFRLFRVGLLGIGEGGELQWLLSPRRRRPVSGPRTFMAAIDLVRKGSHHGVRLARRA